MADHALLRLTAPRFTEGLWTAAGAGARASVRAMNRAARLALLLAPLLAGCQDRQARAETGVLAGRVAALEAEVRELRAAQAAGPSVAPSLPQARAATTRAAALNCAAALARSLETYRSGSLETRYPPQARAEVPDACAGQRVEWVRLEAQRYTFRVLSAGGRELARQSGP